MFPWLQHLVIHALYEWTLAINLTAALFFWGVEVLFWSQRDPKSFRAITFGELGFKYLTHTLPLILLIFEWWHNSIKVAQHRVAAYSVFVTVYSAILCLVSYLKPDSKPYFAIDFENSRSISSNFITVMSLTFAGSLFVWSVVSFMKFGPPKNSDETTTGGATSGGESTTGDSTTGGGTSGESTTGDSTTGGGTSGESTTGDSTTGSGTGGESTTGDSTTGGETSGESMTSDSTTGSGTTAEGTSTGGGSSVTEDSTTTGTATDATT